MFFVGDLQRQSRNVSGMYLQQVVGTRRGELVASIAAETKIDLGGSESCLGVSLEAR